MAVNTIDAKMLAKMFLAGAKNLESKKEWINELNEHDTDNYVCGKRRCSDECKQ